MSDERPNSIDEYFTYLDLKIKDWSSDQRLALAAGMAERWLHVYDTFSAEEQWGDPEFLHQSLEAVWNHLGGKKLELHDLKRYLKLVEDSTPHMDFFDDHAALAASFMVKEALECCLNDHNTAPAVQAVISGFEAVLPFWEEELEAQPRLWKQISVRSEFEKQLRLINAIDPVSIFDLETIQNLRENLNREAQQGAVAPAAQAPTGAVTVTNQWAFERYRSVMEVDLKQERADWKDDYEQGSFGWAMMVFSEWSARYGRRQQILEGEYGMLGDAAGIRALMARNRALDEAISGIPDWGSEMDELFQMMQQNPHGGHDVPAVDQPHSYGPSFRRLWIEGEHSGQEPRRVIQAWKTHIPSAWEREDRRKKQGLAFSQPDLGQYLAQEINWHSTEETTFPWVAEVGNQIWKIRLNDFPDEIMYTLMINGQPYGDFHDWPETWRRQ
jgi:uncharacterized protein YjaG (DUF416 family)